MALYETLARLGSVRQPSDLLAAQRKNILEYKTLMSRQVKVACTMSATSMHIRQGVRHSPITSRTASHFCTVAFCVFLSFFCTVACDLRAICFAEV